MSATSAGDRTPPGASSANSDRCETKPRQEENGRAVGNQACEALRDRALERWENEGGSPQPASDEVEAKQGPTPQDETELQE